MNIHTERLEDHTARFTVEIEAERFDTAKRKAARKIAKQVRIPGFRKGKAPYHILVQHGFEANIVNDALDDLTQDIYRETLEQTEDIDVYGPGNLEDVKLEEDTAPTFIYTVPLQPTVELNEYRGVRLDYTAPEVTDEMVDDAMNRLQADAAVVEESEEAIVAGNRVTLDIHSEFIDDAPEIEDVPDEEVTDDASEEDSEEDAESDEDEATDDEETHKIPVKGDQFLHQHEAAIDLDPENEPILPGFIDAMVGANVGEDVSFELTIPEDDENYEDIAGRKIKFDVTISKVEVVTLPELNDELAADLTKDEDEQLDLAQLRLRMRENLTTEAENRAKSEYSRDVLDKMVEGADISYPEAMIDTQAESMVEDLDRNFRQQGMSLDMYMKVTGQSREEIKANYRESAIQTIERSLAMREVLEQLEVTVSDKAIDKQIDTIVSQYGEQAEAFRSVFDTPQMRSSVNDDLINQKVMEAIGAIGKGEDLATVLVEEDEEDEVVETEVTGEDGDDVEAPVASVESEDDQDADGAETEEPASDENSNEDGDDSDSAETDTE